MSPGEQKPQSDTDAGGENRPTLPRMRLDRRNMYTGHRICRSPSPPAPKRQPDTVERRRIRCRRGSRLEFALFYCSERKSRETDSASSELADRRTWEARAASCGVKLKNWSSEMRIGRMKAKLRCILEHLRKLLKAKQSNHHSHCHQLANYILPRKEEGTANLCPRIPSTSSHHYFR